MAIQQPREFPVSGYRILQYPTKSQDFSQNTNPKLEKKESRFEKKETYIVGDVWFLRLAEKGDARIGLRGQNINKGV